LPKREEGEKRKGVHDLRLDLYFLLREVHFFCGARYSFGSGGGKVGFVVKSLLPGKSRIGEQLGASGNRRRGFYEIKKLL